MKELKSQYRSVVWEKKKEQKKSCREIRGAVNDESLSCLSLYLNFD